MTRHRNPANLQRVLELTVAALLRYLIPAVFLNQLQHIANFRATNSIRASSIAPIEMRLLGQIQVSESIRMSLSAEGEKAAAEAVERILAELRSTSPA